MAAWPLDVVELGQFKVCLVHQRRCAERMPGELAAQVTVRHALEYLVDDRKYVVEVAVESTAMTRGSGGGLWPLALASGLKYRPASPR